MKRQEVARAILVGVVLLAFTGCVTANVAGPVKPQEVLVRVQGSGDVKAEPSDPDKVSRTMSIPYEGVKWPSNAHVIGDTAYYELWGGISTTEALDIWRTIKIAEHRKVGKLHIYINSGGGSAFDGLAIADMLIQAKGKGMAVTTEASGLVASAAVPIFAVGQKRIASEGTIFMIHEGKLLKFLTSEGKDDLISQQKMMDITEGRYNRLLQKHSKLSLEQIEKMSAKTTWFTSLEAQEWGLVDEVL